MRRDAPWMEQLDERILEHLADEPWSSPAVMATYPGFRASTARLRERCAVLSDVGLAAPLYPGADAHELTAAGQRYLDGRLDASLLRAAADH